MAGIYNKVRDTKAKIRLAILFAYLGAAAGAAGGWGWVTWGTADSFQYVFGHWLKWRVVHDLGMLDFLVQWDLFPRTELDWLKSIEIRPGWLDALLGMKRTIYYSIAGGAIAVPVVAAIAISVQERRQQQSGDVNFETDAGDGFRRN